MNTSTMPDKISNLESTRLCPSQTSTPVQQSHRRSTDWNVPPDFLSNASMFCPPSYSPIPSAPEEGFFSATRMMNSDGIEHLIEHTPTEALEQLLQNAHNLTQIPLPPENPLQQDPPSQNSLPHQNLPPQSTVPVTNVPPQPNEPPGKRPFDSQCSEDNSSNSQSKCAKITHFDNNMYERTLAKHVQASKENVGLVQKAKLELFRCIITTLFMYAVPPMLESSIRNVSVHSVVQIVMDHEEDSLSDAFNLCVEHTIGSSERTIHKVSGSLVEALKVYFTQIRPFFVTNHTKLAIVRYEKADKRPINTELFFVNSIGKTDFRVKSVVDLFISSKKAETKDQYTLKGKVAELMPLSNDPCFKITKLKHAVNLVLSNVKGFDKDDVRNAVRARQDQQRYTRQSARALLYFEHVSGKVAINCLESRVAAFFQRQKWTSPEDKNQDVKKVTAQLLILSNNQSIRKSSQVPESSGIGGMLDLLIICHMKNKFCCRNDVRRSCGLESVWPKCQNLGDV